MMSTSRWVPQIEEEPAILTHPKAVCIENGKLCPRCHQRPVEVQVEGYLPHPIPIELCKQCSLDLISDLAATVKGELNNV